MLAAVGDRTSLSQLPASASTAATGMDADHAHDEAAWRLRHLPRTALRDVAPGADVVDGRHARSIRATHPGYDCAPPDGSRRLVALREHRASPAGELPHDQLAAAARASTTGAGPGRAASPTWSSARRSARRRLGRARRDERRRPVVVGPARRVPGRARTRRTRCTLGVSLQRAGRRPIASGTLPGRRAVAQRRRRLRLRSLARSAVVLELDYGLRVDRYDYVRRAPLVSPRAGVRLQVAPGTLCGRLRLTTRVAPGADEFLPPRPPARGCRRSARSRRSAALRSRAERVGHYEVGLEQQFGSRRPSAARCPSGASVSRSTIRWRRCSASTAKATSATTTSRRPAMCSSTGGLSRIGGALTPHVRGQVDYSLGQAEWTHEPASAALGRACRSSMRDDRERIHDLTTAITGSFPAHRHRGVVRLPHELGLQSGRSREPSSRVSTDASTSKSIRRCRTSRFAAASSRSSFAVRNLFRDARDTRSLYDELLTVGRRCAWSGGVQIRF